MKYFSNIIMFIAYLGLSTANAAERHIHLNGEHLSEELILGLDYLANLHVEDNFYWIDFETGAWGYEGNEQTIGYLDLSRMNNTQNT